MKLIRTKLSGITCYSSCGSEERKGDLIKAKEIVEITADYGAEYVEPEEGISYPQLIKCSELLLTADQYADLIIKGIELAPPVYLKTKGRY